MQNLKDLLQWFVELKDRVSKESPAFYKKSRIVAFILFGITAVVSLVGSYIPIGLDKMVLSLFTIKQIVDFVAMVTGLWGGFSLTPVKNPEQLNKVEPDKTES